MSSRLVFCADLGGTKVAAAAVTRKGKIVDRTVELVDRSSKFAAILQIKRLALQLAKPRRVAEVFAAGGVAFPGLVRRSGTVWAPNLQGWEHVPLGSRLQRSVGIPFAIESDRNAAALGETWLGAARGKKDAVVLIMGTGIGAGIISAGHLVRGAHELSGCAGWLVVTDAYPNEARRIGQLEAFTAGPSLPRAAAELLKQGATGALSELSSEELTGIAVAKAARAGDRVARSVFEQIGNTLGRGVANIISLFDPEVVIISGGMAEKSGVVTGDQLDRLALKGRDLYNPADAPRLYVPAMNGTTRMGYDPVTGVYVPAVAIGALVPGSGNFNNGSCAAGQGGVRKAWPSTRRLILDRVSAWRTTCSVPATRCCTSALANSKTAARFCRPCTQPAARRWATLQPPTTPPWTS